MSRRVHSSFLALTCAFLAVLASCGGAGGGDGSPAAPSTLTAVVVDDLDAYLGKTLLHRVDRDGVVLFSGTRSISRATETIYYTYASPGRALVVVDLDGDGRCDAPPGDAVWYVDLTPGGTTRIDSTTPQAGSCPP